MRFQTIITSGIALALPLLHQVVGDCPTEDFQLRFYAHWESKYLINYRGKNTTNPDNPEEIVDKIMNSYYFDWGDEAKGGNDTLKIGGLYIKREDITNEHPFEIHFSDQITYNEIKLFAPEVYGQSLKVSHLETSRGVSLTMKCAVKMAEDLCVLRLSWYFGHGLCVEGEELAKGRPVKGVDSMRLTCKGDLNLWDWSVMMAGSPEIER
jgi:hypothetical protein